MSGNGYLEGHADSYEPSSWNVICQRCGRKYKNYEVQREWTGLIVCKETCFELRHPQDFVRAVIDDTSVATHSPPPPDAFVSITYDATVLYCGVFGRYCQADYMQADCATVGTIDGNLV